MNAADDPGPSITQTVSGDATVEAQIGVIHGDAHFYRLAEGATAEEKFQTGRRYLDGNMPRQAEELIHDAIMHGYSTAETAYYWALSILSGKSLDHVSMEDFERLAAASQQVRASQAEDEWSRSLDVIIQLVQSLMAQQERGTVDVDAFELVLAAYQRLSDQHREEIRRHLEMIMAGGIQDQIATLDAATINRERMGASRTQRAWKFFEHTPSRPRRQDPRPVTTDVRAWILMLAGAALTLIALSLLLRAVFTTHLVTGLVVVGLGALAGWFAFGHTRRALRLAGARRVQEERFPGGTPAPLTLPQREAERDFAVQVGLHVSYFYLREYPKPKRVPGVATTEDDDETASERARRQAQETHRWADQTAGVRDLLTRRLIAQYGVDRPRPTVGSLDWLIRWHAQTYLDAAAAETVHAFRTALRLSIVERIVLAAAWAGVLVATLVGVAAVGGLAGFGLTVLIAAGVWLTIAGGIPVGIAGCRRRAEQAEFDRALAAETTEYERWCQVLADAPNDTEMARWLDYDQAHVKALYLKEFGLANRDVIHHVPLIEGAPTAVRARVLFGPPRYSIYTMQLFLLTAAGVRQVSVEVDFCSGALDKEARSSFRYEAVTSARLSRVRVRRTESIWEIIGLADGAHELGLSDGRVTTSQAFRISLNNTESINVLVENYEGGLMDRLQEDPEQLNELARDASGVSTAVRVLEAVAAEGPRWMEEEQARRHRRIAWYQRTRARRAPAEVESDRSVHHGPALEGVVIVDEKSTVESIVESTVEEKPAVTETSTMQERPAGVDGPGELAPA